MVTSPIRNAAYDKKHIILNYELDGEFRTGDLVRTNYKLYQQFQAEVKIPTDRHLGVAKCTSCMNGTGNLLPFHYISSGMSCFIRESMRETPLQLTLSSHGISKQYPTFQSSLTYVFLMGSIALFELPNKGFTNSLHKSFRLQLKYFRSSLHFLILYGRNLFILCICQSRYCLQK